MADWQCFCTTLNKPDARECWVAACGGQTSPRAEASAARARPVLPYPSPPPLPTAPAQASRPSAAARRARLRRGPSAPPGPHRRRRAGRVAQTQPRKKPPIDLTADSDDEEAALEAAHGRSVATR